MNDHRLIWPDTLKTLLNAVSDPRRPGGIARAFEIIGHSKLSLAFRTEHCGEIETLEDANDFFSSMLEEEAVAMSIELGDRMPSLTKATLAAIVRRLHASA